MRILIVSNLFPPDYDGGLEMNAWKLARALRARGHEVFVATSRFREGFVPTGDEPEWVHRIFTFAPAYRPVSGGLGGKIDHTRQYVEREKIAIQNTRALLKLLADLPVDFGYVFGMHRVGTPAVAAFTDRKLPVLWHCGDHYLADREPEHFAPGKLLKAVQATVVKEARDLEARVDYSHIAFVSQYLCDHFAEKGFPLQTTYIIPRGIEFPLGEDVDRVRSTPPAFLTASQLIEHKGIHVAIEAAGLLNARRPELEWQLQIVGKGRDEYRQRLADLAYELGIESRIHFLGMLPRDEVLARMRDATAFISASLWGEPFANTIIESLASGTPLIGAQTGSILEVVRDEESALIYSKDDATALSARMERILTDPELARRLAARGLEVIRRGYTMDAILDRTERVFEELLVTRA
ncbi:MAG TPA: glycosyltransferase family 4 protein [Fimbriimonadaceae bacterium]|nr:glycosyltransferase family 4 protein [Fimbriimonadaceae bacterium]